VELPIVVAIFSLGGVVVGSVLTQGAQFFLEVRRDRRAVRRARRLVAAELLQATLMLRSIASVPSKAWPVFDASTVLQSTAWQEQRATLSDQLDEDAWNQLALTYAELESEKARLTIAADNPPSSQMPESVIAGIREFVGRVEASRRALGGGGGWLKDRGA
jgi:hypothetical protein